jgi:hypothetical protein
MSNHRGWIGVDLDGTLAEYGEWRGADHIGPPIPAMLARVRRWLEMGLDVRIFTARVGPQPNGEDVVASEAIAKWCREHIGRALPITATKDYSMVELWDDRCVQVIPNTGLRADGES